MKIAVFGGSFDPPHLGHQHIAEYIVEHGFSQRVIFVPCANHPFHKTLSPAPVRLKMLAALGAHEVSTVEIDRQGQSYSIDTLEQFATRDPNDTFVWVMGSDQVASFRQWHRYEELLTRFGVLVYPRLGHEANELLPGMTLLTGATSINISSTMIRERVARGEAIQSFVPAAVATCIKEQQLYVKHAR